MNSESDDDDQISHSRKDGLQWCEVLKSINGTLGCKKMCSNRKKKHHIWLGCGYH